MRKIKMVSLIALIGLLLLASLSWAQAPAFLKAKAPPPKGIATLGGAIGEGLPINLEGDTLYRIRGNSFDGGVGMDLASYQGIVTLRAELSQGGTGSPFSGAGFMLNIPTLLNKIPGVNWQAGAINPSIGIVPGYDFGEKRFDVGIVLSVINITFP